MLLARPPQGVPDALSFLLPSFVFRPRPWRHCVCRPIVLWPQPLLVLWPLPPFVPPQRWPAARSLVVLLIVLYLFSMACTTLCDIKGKRVLRATTRDFPSFYFDLLYYKKTCISVLVCCTYVWKIGQSARPASASETGAPRPMCPYTPPPPTVRLFSAGKILLSVSTSAPHRSR